MRKDNATSKRLCLLLSHVMVKAVLAPVAVNISYATVAPLYLPLGLSLPLVYVPNLGSARSKQSTNVLGGSGWSQQVNLFAFAYYAVKQSCTYHVKITIF